MATNDPLARVNPQRELDLRGEIGKDKLPSPKRVAKRAHNASRLPWQTNYAAFSSEFAHAAVRRLAHRKNTIYDPFAGSGTTIEAAVTAGVNSYGIELNPYSSLLARCRVALNADLKAVRDLLSRASSIKRRSSVAPGDCLIDEGANTVRNLLETISRSLNCSSVDVVSRICAFRGEQYDSHIAALVSALHATRQRAKVHFRSNPAWLLSGIGPDGDIQVSESWYSEAMVTAKAIVSDLSTRKANASSAVTIFSGRFQDAPVRLRSITRFLTSPPYLNRLDYVNPTLPELYALGSIGKESVELLRSQMMGTTKMRSNAGAQLPIPSKAVERILGVISNHPTKASATYYLRFYQQYFEDLFAFLKWLDIHSSDSCQGILVLQDSYYKNIKIPIVEIFAELANNRGFSASVIFEETRIKHMGSLSPHQRGHAPSKSLTEYTIAMARTR